MQVLEETEKLSIFPKYIQIIFLYFAYNNISKKERSQQYGQ